MEVSFHMSKPATFSSYLPPCFINNARFFQPPGSSCAPLKYSNQEPARPLSMKNEASLKLAERKLPRQLLLLLRSGDTLLKRKKSSLPMWRCLSFSREKQMECCVNRIKQFWVWLLSPCKMQVFGCTPQGGIAGSHGGTDGEESTCNAGGPHSISGSGRSPGEENGNPLQDSCLENSMDSGAWQVTVHGITKSQICLRDLTPYAGI
ncbi:uncharacterized protein [Odocoileus virginianus]|uniref:Uncharacterized protein n=1 Tax=Odocoileus virginianus TaxID=9874 RepID=A0ABM4I495_ODOVR